MVWNTWQWERRRPHKSAMGRRYKYSARLWHHEGVTNPFYTAVA